MDRKAAAMDAIRSLAADSTLEPDELIEALNEVQEVLQQELGTVESYRPANGEAFADDEHEEPEGDADEPGEDEDEQ
jgi:hypothetical protein